MANPRDSAAKRVLCLLLLLSAFASSVNAQEGKDLESFVYGALADFQAAHDDIARSGYACMAVGSMQESPSLRRDTDARTVPALKITCRRGDYLFYANSSQMMANRFLRGQDSGDLEPAVIPSTSWTYEVFDGSRVKVLRTLRAPVEHLTRSQFLKSRNSTVKKHDPFEDYLFPTRVDSTRLPADFIRDFVANVRLVDTSDLGSGQIKAVFHRAFIQRVYKYEIIFSKAHGGMPIDVKITFLKSHVASDMNYMCHGRYQWEKHGEDLWLPRRIEFARTVSRGEIWESDLVLSWKLGEEVPDKCVDFENADHLGSIGELFGFDVDVYEGNRLVRRAERNWTLPEELDK